MEEKKTTKNSNVKKNTKVGSKAATAKKNTTKKNSNASHKKVTKSNTSAKKGTNKNNSNKTVKNNVSAVVKEEKQNKNVVKEENIAKEEKKAQVKEEVKNNKKEEVKPVSKVKDTTDFGGDEIRKLLIIIGAVCAVMLAFYFITEVVLKNKKDKEPDGPLAAEVEPTIQYEEILMGSLLKQEETDYYVLVYDPEDIYLDMYMNYISNYTKSDEPLSVYKVNLGKDYNKKYIAEESNLTGSDITMIKVKGTTLIRVSNGSVYKSFEGNDAIIGRFKYMLDLD